VASPGSSPKSPLDAAQTAPVDPAAGTGSGGGSGAGSVGARSERSESELAEVLEPGHEPSEGLGGKGRALARLVTAGYPVPPTGVVTTEAYRIVAAHGPIATVIEKIMDGEEVEADAVDQVFASVTIASEVEAAVVSMASAVGEAGPVAVRSSATVEDLHGSSFAGQYHSELNIDSSDPATVMASVARVWASLWHPAPTAYRRAFGIDESDVAMAVVVMKMIPATTAGVVFTADPGGSSGARVEAVEGLGESLVSGERTPSAWVVADDSPEGVQADTLPAAAATALQLALDVERSFGVPQDIEWAAVDDDVFVVQARPITVLDDHDGFDTTIDDHELTTGGIVEMVPGVLPPMRWEINRFLLEEAFRSVLDSLGLIRGLAAEDSPFIRRVRGRVALDFDQLRAVASDIPGAVEELERQYFGRTDTDTDTDTGSEAVARGGVAGDSVAGGSAAGGTAVAGRGSSLRRRMAALEREFRSLQTRRVVVEQSEVLIQVTAQLRDRRRDVTAMSDDDLLAYARRLVDLAARGLAAELGVAAAGAAVYGRLQGLLSKHLGPEEGARAVQALTSGGMAAVRHSESSAAVFAGPTWIERGTTPPAPPSGGDEAQSQRRDDVEAQIKALPGWTRRRILTGQFIDIRLHLIRRTAAEAVEQLRRREQAKAAVLELGGEVRRIHLELGRRLGEQGIIEDPTDIELLSSAELVVAVGGSVPVRPEIVRRRRNWLTRYVAEGVLPIRFVGVPDREPEPLPEGDVLSGWGASPGRSRGRARVVTDPDDGLERGEIIVAQATDASWSPLFIRAAAIIVERGGPLSHAAILARELGLPCVMNVPGATRLLDGRTVSVDGDNGVVVIEDKSEDGTVTGVEVSSVVDNKDAAS